MATTDLNADLGEQPEAPELDAALLDVVTSANVACGGHAGDNASMLRVCRIAKQREVAIGAQISYVDREGFGRRRLDVAPDVLIRQLSDQIQRLDVIAAQVGTTIHYVKPHGALYNTAVEDAATADAILAAMKRHQLEVPVLTLPDSELADAAQRAGFEVHAEFFADRAYTDEGRLMPRSEPGAVLTDHTVIIDRVIEATRSSTPPSSVCVHSDTPNAVDIARSLRAALEEAGITLAPFAPPRS